MRSSGLHKNCQKCPSLLLHMHSSSSWPPQHSFKMQNTWAFSTWPPHLLLYISLCSNASTHTQRTSVLLKCIQASSNYWEWEEWKLLSKRSFWAQKTRWQAQIGNQTHLTLSFGPKVEFGTLFNPFVFFSCPVLSFVPGFGQTGGSRALFQWLYG
jgi:hypothetical protein